MDSKITIINKKNKISINPDLGYPHIKLFMVILWPTEVTVEHEHFEFVVILYLQLMVEILHFNEVLLYMNS